MILKAITLENFRSAERECIHFDPGVNLLYGNNAEGKTNVLEAIYFFARGRSFRTTRESDLVRFGAEGCGVDIAFTRRGEEETLGYRYFGGTRRRTKNGVKVTAREALGVFCAVLSGSSVGHQAHTGGAARVSQCGDRADLARLCGCARAAQKAA